MVNDWDELTRRVREIRKTFDDEALAEEFIDGREVYVAVIGTPTRPEILPIVELDFGAWKAGEPKVSDREVKFGPETEGEPAAGDRPATCSPELKARIERAALLAYRALKIRDYARVDFRISSKTGEPFVLEVNPNPYLEKRERAGDGRRGARHSYTQLIGRIVESAATRYQLKVKGSRRGAGAVGAPR